MHPFLRYCYQGIPHRFRYRGRLLFVTQDKNGKDLLMEVKENE